MTGLLDSVTKQSLILTSSSLSVYINGFASSVLASLNYFNQFDHEIEAMYVYDDIVSTVTDLKATIGNRRIQMEVREAAFEKTGKTKADPDEAKTQSVFAISIGKIPPNGNVLLEVKVIGELKTANDEALVFKTPQVFTPFYCGQRSKDSAILDEGGHDDCVEVESLCVNLQPYAFDIKIRAAIPCLLAGCFSPSHAIRVDADANAVNAETVVITLAEGYKYDREIEVLLYLSLPLESYVAIEPGHSTSSRKAGVSKGNVLNDGVIALSFMPHLPAVPVFGEFIFMVDRSGSMNGSHISDAKESLVLFLKSLPSTACFNVVSFGSYSRSLFPTSQPYNQENLEKACGYVNNIHADMGGSELLEPLKALLEQPLKNGHSRNIFLLTDGDISHPDTILDHLRVNSQKARIFAFGIGPKISRDIVSRIARAGQGKAYFASPGVKIQTKIVKCLKEALQPALCNIKVNWELPESFLVHHSSREIPFAFTGQRLNIFASVTLPTRALQRLGSATRKELHHVSSGVKEFWFDEDFASCQLGDAFPDDLRDDDEFPRDWDSDSDICSQCSDYEPLPKESEEFLVGKGAEDESHEDGEMEYGDIESMDDEIPSKDTSNDSLGNNIGYDVARSDLFIDCTGDVTATTDLAPYTGINPFSNFTTDVHQNTSNTNADLQRNSNNCSELRCTENIDDNNIYKFDNGQTCTTANHNNNSYTTANTFTNYSTNAQTDTCAETDTINNPLNISPTARNTTGRNAPGPENGDSRTRKSEARADITDINIRERNPYNFDNDGKNRSSNISQSTIDNDSDNAEQSERNIKRFTPNSVSSLSDTVIQCYTADRTVRLKESDVVDDRVVITKSILHSTQTRDSTQALDRNNSQPMLVDLYDVTATLSHRSGCHENSSENPPVLNATRHDEFIAEENRDCVKSGNGCCPRDWGCYPRDWGTAIVTGYLGPEVFKERIHFRLKLTPSSDHHQCNLHQMAAVSFIRNMEATLERNQSQDVVEKDIVELSKSSALPSRLTSQVTVDEEGDIIGERQDSFYLSITRKQRASLSSSAHKVPIRQARSSSDPPTILVSSPSVDEEPRSPPKRRHGRTREEENQSDEEGKYYCLERLGPEGCDDVRPRSDTIGACHYRKRLDDCRHLPMKTIQRRKIVSARLTLLTRKMKHAQKLNVFAGPPFIRLILHQAAEGFWQLTYAFARIVGLPLIQLELAAPFADCTMIPFGEHGDQLGIDCYYDSLALWATAVALVYLKRKWRSHEKEWELVAGKGEMWLKNQTFPQGFAYDDVMLAARQAIVLLEQKYRSRAKSEPIGLVK